ncbi:MAG: M48 family metalloprotease, partial [Proteobacteria bacterium]|nr:M48 family metalloprotease [Pseudomonadota bacterium]
SKKILIIANKKGHTIEMKKCTKIGRCSKERYQQKSTFIFFSASIAIGAMLPYALVSCRTTSDISQSKHTEAEILQSTFKYQWADVPQIEQATVSSTFIPGSKVAEDGHPLLDIGGAWISRIHSKMLVDHPELKIVPTPKLMVMVSPRKDALSITNRICFDAKISGLNPAGPKFDALSISGKLTSIPRDPRAQALDFSLSKSTKFPCNIKEISDIDIDNINTHINKELNDCGFAFKKSSPKPELEITGTCSGKDFSTANLLAIPAVSNWVVVTDGLIKTLKTEKEFVYVLAHELAHIYRAHLVTNRSKVEFFYQQNFSEPLSIKPKAADSSLGFTELAKQLSPILTNMYTISVDNAFLKNQLQPEIAKPLMEWLMQSDISQICVNGTSCQNECFIAKTGLEKISNTVGWKEFPRSSKNFANIKSDYESAETAFLQCSKNISVTAGIAKNQQVDQNSLLNLIRQHWSNQGLRLIADINAVTLNDALKSWSKFFTDQDLSLRELLEKSEKNRFGYYTAEQEADDLALEIIAKFGIEPVHAMHGILNLGIDRESTSNRPRKPFLSSEECLALTNSDRGFMRDDQTPMIIHIGALSDPHHSYCFRAFNMWQEERAHKRLINEFAYDWNQVRWESITK